MATIVLIIFAILCSTISIWHLLHKKCHKTSKPHKGYYLIEPRQNLSSTATESNYIIEKIGYFVGEGSKQGLSSVDIRVDLRHTQASSVYKAIGALDFQDGITISEKEKSPSMLLLSVEWRKLQDITA